MEVGGVRSDLYALQSAVGMAMAQKVMNVEAEAVLNLLQAISQASLDMMNLPAGFSEGTLDVRI